MSHQLQSKHFLAMKLFYGIVTLLALGVLGVTVAKSSKIDAAVTKLLQENDRVKILVSMKDGIQDILDAHATKSFSSRGESSQALYDALKSRADKSQSKLLRLLSTPSISKKFGFVKVKGFWITNQVSIESASSEFVDYLASMKEISRIHENAIVKLHQPIVHQVVDDRPAAINAVQWGVAKVQAPEAWKVLEASNSNNQIVVGSLDTGCRWTHEALRSNFKPGNHSWFDPWYGDQVPNDYNGHGTHTMATIVGQNGFGVAPKAQWISCRALDDSGSGSDGSILACGEFIACPSRPDGSEPDCNAAPNIVSNSWGSTVSGVNYFASMTAVWRALGIIPTFASGNDGPSCNTTRSPGDYENVISVGATDINDAIGNFSSVGPGQKGSFKPEISAPGVAVTSAFYSSDTAYATASGTSMATPHVTGGIALFLTANPALNYTQVRDYLINNIDQNLTSSNATCGGIPDTTFPNYIFGYGRLNILRAVNAILGIS